MKIKNIKSRYNNQGFTLIELLIAISLTAVITSGLYIVANNASDRKKVNVEVNNVNSLIKKIDGVTINSDFAGLSNNQLTTLGVNFTSEFKNPVVQGIDPKSYSITYNNINARQCTDFSSKTQLKITSLQNITTKINGQEFNSNDVEGIAGACSSDLNEIVLIVKGNTNTVLASVAQDAPPPPHVTPGDLNINPARPPSGSFGPIGHQTVGAIGTPIPLSPIVTYNPTSNGPTGMGSVATLGPNAPISVTAPLPPPPPPPPSSSSSGTVICEDVNELYRRCWLEGNPGDYSQYN